MKAPNPGERSPYGPMVAPYPLDRSDHATARCGTHAASHQVRLAHAHQVVTPIRWSSPHSASVVHCTSTACGVHRGALEPPSFSL